LIDIVAIEKQDEMVDKYSKDERIMNRY
jgi:hypothetical protein